LHERIYEVTRVLAASSVFVLLDFQHAGVRSRVLRTRRSVDM